MIPLSLYNTKHSVHYVCYTTRTLGGGVALVPHKPNSKKKTTNG